MKSRETWQIYFKKLFSVQVWDLCMQSTGLYSGFSLCWMELSAPSQWRRLRIRALHKRTGPHIDEFPNFAVKPRGLPLALQGKAYWTEMEWEIKCVGFHHKSVKVLITEDHIASSTTKLGRGLNLIFRICSDLSSRGRVISFIIRHPKFPGFSSLSLLALNRHTEAQTPPDQVYSKNYSLYRSTDIV